MEAITIILKCLSSLLCIVMDWYWSITHGLVLVRILKQFWLSKSTILIPSSCASCQSNFEPFYPSSQNSYRSIIALKRSCFDPSQINSKWLENLLAFLIYRHDATAQTSSPSITLWWIDTVPYGSLRVLTFSYSQAQNFWVSSFHLQECLRQVSSKSKPPICSVLQSTYLWQPILTWNSSNASNFIKTNINTSIHDQTNKSKSLNII